MMFENHENILFSPLTTYTLQHFTLFPGLNLEKVWNFGNHENVLLSPFIIDTLQHFNLLPGSYLDKVWNSSMSQLLITSPEKCAFSMFGNRENILFSHLTTNTLHYFILFPGWNLEKARNSSMLVISSEKSTFMVFENHENILFSPLTTGTLQHFTLFPGSNLEKVWDSSKFQLLITSPEKCIFSVFGNHENTLFYPLNTNTLQHFTLFPASNLEKVWNNDNCWLPVPRKVHFRYLETTKMYFSLLWLLTLCSISLCFQD